jgi:hypothetical protein
MGKMLSSLWRKKDRNGARDVLSSSLWREKRNLGAQDASSRAPSRVPRRRRRRGSISDRDRVTQLSKYHVELMCDTVVC